MRIRIRGPLLHQIETRAAGGVASPLRARAARRVFSRASASLDPRAHSRVRAFPPSFASRGRSPRETPGPRERPTTVSSRPLGAGNHPSLVAPPSVDARDAGVRRVRAGRVQTERWRRSSRRLRDGRRARRARCAPPSDPAPSGPSRVPKFPDASVPARATESRASRPNPPPPRFRPPLDPDRLPPLGPSPAQPPSRARRAVPRARRSRQDGGVSRAIRPRRLRPALRRHGPSRRGERAQALLRDPPEPLLTHRLYDSVLAAATIRGSNGRRRSLEDLHLETRTAEGASSLPRRSSRAVVALRTLLERLDAASRRTLRVTLAFASRVALADAATATERRLGRRFVGDSDGSTASSLGVGGGNEARSPPRRFRRAPQTPAWVDRIRRGYRRRDARRGVAHPPPRRSARPREDRRGRPRSEKTFANANANDARSGGARARGARGDGGRVFCRTRGSCFVG